MVLPLGFLFFLRLLPQRHCSICVPLLTMFHRNHIDLGEEQSRGLNTQMETRSSRLHNKSRSSSRRKTVEEVEEEEETTETLLRDGVM